MASKRSSLCWSSMDLITLATLWPSFGSSSASAILAKGFLFTVFHSGQSFFMWPCFWHLKHRPSFLSLSFLVDHFWLLGFPVEAASISIGTTSHFFFPRHVQMVLKLGLPDGRPNTCTCGSGRPTQSWIHKLEIWGTNSRQYEI